MLNSRDLSKISNLEPIVLRLLGAEIMLQLLRLFLQLDDALLEPLDLPLQRGPLRLFALELKSKFMMSGGYGRTRRTDGDLLPISNLPDHSSNESRGATRQAADKLS